MIFLIHENKFCIYPVNFLAGIILCHAAVCSGDGGRPEPVA